MEPVVLHTQRLILRQWQADDFQAFAAMNSDPNVMAYFPAPLSLEENQAMFAKAQGLIQQKGWGFWAVERRDTGQVIGFTGLNAPKETIPCAPCVEIGWRLAAEHWGQGFAPEAAEAALTYAFDTLALDRVVAFTTRHNDKSRRVMEKLGMQNTGRDFRHPDLAKDHPLAEHVLYDITASAWREQEQNPHVSK